MNNVMILTIFLSNNSNTKIIFRHTEIHNIALKLKHLCKYWQKQKSAVFKIFTPNFPVKIIFHEIIIKIVYVVNSFHNQMAKSPRAQSCICLELKATGLIQYLLTWLRDTLSPVRLCERRERLFKYL